MEDTKKYVAYYRVSRDSFKDGKSKSKGLGLDAQRNIVEYYYKENIVKEYTETKSAKNITDRPVLQEAIDYCLKNNCFLVVAKLDRLSRNTIDALSIVSQLNKKIYFCDIPGEADEFMITIFAAIAQRERELISIRTRLALEVRLGRYGKRVCTTDSFLAHQEKWVKSGKMREKGVEANKEKAKLNANSIRAMEVIAPNKREGKTFSEIATILNEKKFVTPNGLQFHPAQVQRLYQRSLSV